MSIDYDKEFIEMLEDMKFMLNSIKGSIRNGNKPSLKGKNKLIMLVLKKDGSCIKKLVRSQREIDGKR